MAELEHIYLYDAPEAAGLDLADVAAFLRELIPTVATEMRTDYLTHHLVRFDPEQVKVLTAELSKRLDEREVTNLVYPEDRELLPPESPKQRGLQTVYLAGPLQEVLAPLLPEDERGPAHLHLLFISHCVGAWSQQRREFALRIMQPGQPTLISAACFIEAMRPSREYSFRRAHLVALGLGDALDDLDEQFTGRTFGYGDPRLTEIAAGYALQAVFHHLFGEVECEDPTCRLHRATTQEEMAAAQFGPDAGLCERHARMLREAL